MPDQPEIPAQRPQDPPTTWLVRGAKAGGTDLFNQLYERVAPAIFAWANLRIRPSVRSAVDPEDLVQEVWVRALKRFADYDPDETPFRPWVFRIANNVLLEAFKALRGRPLPAGGAGTSSSRILAMEAVPDEATSISRRAARNEALQRFIGQLGTLDEDERRLLIYRGLEGLSHAEVAERLRVGDDSVRKRWQRLREKLEAMGPPPELMESD